MSNLSSWLGKILPSIGTVLGGPLGGLGIEAVWMADIQLALKQGNLEEIPDLLRSMKRLWPETAGLRIRRDDEASLFEAAIA